MNRIIFTILFLFNCFTNGSITSRFESLRTKLYSVDNYLESKQFDLLETSTFNCTYGATACSYHGTCDATGEFCHCQSDYITFEPDNDVQCNYKQKNTITAFCLHFFFGYFGAGEWYLGNNDIAGAILGYLLGGLLVICLITCIATALCEEFGFGLASCINCLWTIGLVIWWIYELVIIGSGMRTDGNGAPINSL